MMCACTVKDGQYYPVGQGPIPNGPYQSDQGPFYANGTPVPANVVNNNNQNNNANSNNNQGELSQCRCSFTTLKRSVHGSLFSSWMHWMHFISRMLISCCS